MKKLIYFNLLAALLVAGFASAASGQRILGGFSPISVDDPKVVEAADFAVNKRVETNTEQEGLTLDSIDKAESQSVAGRNYRLCMTVSIEDESQQVQAVVYLNLKQEYSLTSWNVVETCGTGVTTKGSAKAAKCTGAQLSLAEGEAESDMGGKRYGEYIFTNISKAPCTLNGFPTFSLLDKTGKAMRVAVKNDNDFVGSNAEGKSPSTVKLGAGEKAYFQIFYNDGMALEPQKRVATSAKAKISAPGDTKVFVINSAVQACCGVQVTSVMKVEPE